MYALDFEYDGQCLSDYGFILCSFGGQSDTNTISAGSKITFNKVKRHYGKTHSLTSSEYQECIQSEFEICKNVCDNAELFITDDEFRDVMRWLNRKKFLRFRLLDKEELQEAETCYYDASFNIDKILVDGVLCGLKLTMETNRPFGYGQEYKKVININDTSANYIFVDTSDEIGHTYPDVIIEIKQGGTLVLKNESEPCTTQIKNCVVGEIITMHGDTHIIESSRNSHELYNDFNFDFFKIGNTFTSRDNVISSSLKCTLTIKYNPVIKNSPE